MEDKELLDKIFEGVKDCDLPFEITDSNFNVVKTDIDDSLGGLLANAGLAIAEQKKLLQSANTPLGLQTALKLMGVTVGNLLHASTSMLGWMGKTLNKDEVIKDGEAFNNLKSAAKTLSRGIGKLFSKAMGDFEPSILEEGLSIKSGETNDAVREFTFRLRDNYHKITFEELVRANDIIKAVDKLKSILIDRPDWAGTANYLFLHVSDNAGRQYLGLNKFEDIKKFRVSDSIPSNDSFEVHYQEISNGINYSIIYRSNTEEWFIAIDYNNEDGTWKSAREGFETFAEAALELRKIVE